MKISELIVKASLENQLSPKLLTAIIYQESRGEPRARRFEKGFFNKYLADKTRKTLPGHVPPAGLVSFETEVYSRAFSYGLFQIMGETARENGFDSDYLWDLEKPECNIPLGAKILKGFLDKSGGDVNKALLRWNGGKIPEYPKEVMAHLDAGLGEFLLTGLV